VRKLNLQNGRVAVETNQGFSVIEVRERCALDISDELTGPLDSLGRQVLQNMTKEERFDVFIENVRCTWAEANELLAVRQRT
jgi:hypothetical protein